MPTPSDGGRDGIKAPTVAGRSAPRNVNGKPFTSWGVRSFGHAAWVRHQDVEGTLTEYTVEPRERRHEYLPGDYDVVLKIGPDVLDHDQVRKMAHDAFLDAYGAL